MTVSLSELLDQPPAPPIARPLPVLMYHSVGGPMPERLAELSVPVPALRAQLGALAEAGHRLLGLTDALVAAARGEQVVALTFDDGYTDFLDAALPVLDELGAGATLYLPTRDLGTDAPWIHDARLRLMTPDDVTDLARRDARAAIEIGSHGARHVPMDVLTRREQRAEVRESSEVLRALTGRIPTSFCYPHGYHDRALRRTVAEAGFAHACAIGHRVSPVGEAPMRLSRLLAGPDLAPTDLLDLVDGRAHATGRLLRAVGTTPWRWTRRAVLRTSGRCWT